METYRIFCMDGQRITGAEAFACENDDAAKVTALGLLRCCRHEAAEVWNLARFVARLHRKDALMEGGAT